MFPIKINAKLKAYTKASLVGIDGVTVNEDNLKGDGTKENPLDLVATPDDSTIKKTEEGTKLTAIALLDEGYEESENDTLPNPIKASDIRSSIKELNEKVSSIALFVRYYDLEITGNDDTSLVRMKYSILNPTENEFSLNTEEEVYNVLYELVSTQENKIPVTGYFSDKENNKIYCIDYMYKDSENVVFTNTDESYSVSMNSNSLNKIISNTITELNVNSFSFTCLSNNIK